MSGTHDILAAERAAAAAKQSNQGIWEGRSEGASLSHISNAQSGVDILNAGQVPGGESINKGDITNKGVSSGIADNRTTAQDNLGSTASSDIHSGSARSGISGQPGLQRKSQTYGSKLDENELINVQAATFMDHLFAIVAGLGIRLVIDVVNNQDNRLTGALVGVWEGVVVLHFIKKTPKSFDPHVAYGVRIFIDFLFTESLIRLFMTLVFTGMGILLADIAPAIWAEAGLRRFWRHLRRDLYIITQSVPSIPYFARPRTVRFSPSRATSVITSAPPSPSIITINTQAPTPVPPKRPVPGSFPEYTSETETELSIRNPGSDYSTLTGNTRLRRPTVHTESELSYDPDAENRSSSSSLTPTPALSEADLPNIDDVEDMEQEVVLEEQKDESTPRPLPIQLPPTPSNTEFTLRPLPEEPYEAPPPSAAIPQIPDDDGWENISRREANPSPPPATQLSTQPERTSPAEEPFASAAEQTSNDAPTADAAAPSGSAPVAGELEIDPFGEQQVVPTTAENDSAVTSPPAKNDGDDWLNELDDTAPTTTQDKDIFSTDRPPSYAPFEFGGSSFPGATWGGTIQSASGRMSDPWGDGGAGGASAGAGKTQDLDLWDQELEQAVAPTTEQQNSSTPAEVDLLGSTDAAAPEATTSLQEGSTQVSPITRPEGKTAEASTKQAEVTQPETSVAVETAETSGPANDDPAATDQQKADQQKTLLPGLKPPVIDEEPLPEKNTDRLDKALDLRKEIIKIGKEIMAANRGLVWTTTAANKEAVIVEIKEKQDKLEALKAKAERWYAIGMCFIPASIPASANSLILKVELVSDGDEDDPSKEVDLSEAPVEAFMAGAQTAIVLCLLRNAKSVIIAVGRVTVKGGKARKTALCARLDKLDLSSRAYSIGQKEITVTLPTSDL
ncbi:hypothetical protein H0H87_008103 [Tephrocybe sp. NHM501043]|nr:hypothetical protein H0H87_008103 [Tephrocybe sp. NHM501043]